METAPTTTQAIFYVQSACRLGKIFLSVHTVIGAEF